MEQAKQVKFLDTINGEVFGGIMLEDGSIICGCCGNVISSTLVNDHTYQILEVYSTWVDLSEEITGDNIIVKGIAEIFELEQMLREADIPHEMGKMYDGYFIKVFDPNDNTLCDAVCHKYSYGYAQGLLEIAGGLTEEEEACDGVLGYLTAEEVFTRFRYCYEHDTSTYRGAVEEQQYD